MKGLEPTTFCMASASGRSLPFAPVRSNWPFAEVFVRASEPERTPNLAILATDSDAKPGVARRAEDRAEARSLHGGERERDRLVWRELPALLPRLGEGRFVELRADCGERLFVHLRQP